MVDVSIISQCGKVTILCTRLGISFAQAANSFKLACDAAEQFNRITIELNSAQKPPHHARKNRGFSGYKRYRK